MITIKTAEEIELIRQNGKMLTEILDRLISQAKPGVKTIELNDLAEQLIKEKGGVPAFKNYQGSPAETPFPSAICASVNNQLVHTPAGNYQLKNGDILTIDIGMKYPATGKGYYTDMARTIPIGKISPLARKLLKVTEESFNQGISQVKPGNLVTDISRAVQSYVEKNGFSVVRNLVGHGVGYAVHEDPRIPNYVGPKQPRVELKEGMVLAIEPMVNVGSFEIKTDNDGWTILSADNKLCAHHENTIVVTQDGYEILTRS